MKWKYYNAEAAEAITGTKQQQQAVRRQRGHLTPIVGRHAVGGMILAEMALVEELMPYGVMPKLTLTARARASACVAYWAAIESGASPDAASKILPADQREQPATFMIAHADDKHWRDTILTAGDIADALAKDKKTGGHVVDLRALGKQLAQRAQRAGGLLE